MSNSKGFTFTISILMLCLTLIAMAAYASEWRRSQQGLLSLLLPTDSIRLQERIAAGAAEILGADSMVKKDGSGKVSVKIAGRLPFKKEGEPIARMNDYSASLPYGMRGTWAEAVLSANNLTGSNATVMYVSGTGSLIYNNDGFNDAATYLHPISWAPSSINVSIFCGKAARMASQLSVQETSASPGPSYFVNYSETGGNDFFASNTTAKQGNASISVAYDDGSVLSLESAVSGSGSRNYTRISYTKSPKGFLILPFEQDTDGTPQIQVRDFSPFGNNMSLGGGDAASSPAWSDINCKMGGCYSFDGSNDYLNRSAFDLTESMVEFANGPDMLTDGGLEITDSGLPDDGNTDAWRFWAIANGDGIVFDSTKTSHAGNLAAKIGKGSQKDYLYQQLRILDNVPYTLSFWTRSENGAGSARYAIIEKNDGKYLQEDGSWGGEYFFDSGVTSTGYQQVSREFALPVGSNIPTIELVASDLDIVYFDEVSLKQTAGLNGGFEYYYPDTSN